MNLKTKVMRTGVKLVNSLAQTHDHHNPIKTVTPGMPELLRRAAAEGAVLLENEGALPVKEGSRVSLFGRVQKNWFCTGYGSGGDVNAPYRVSLLEGLRGCDRVRINEDLARIYEQWCEENPVVDSVWGKWPRFYPEMEMPPEQIRRAANVSDQAVIVIGRSAGEDRENMLEQGSYYLTDEERILLRDVTAIFPESILVLNIGSVMDLSFLREYRFGAVLLVWQGGMESGNAVADLLTGIQTPSGRLSDTVALRYEDYPSANCFGSKEANEYREDIYVGYRYFQTFAPDKVLYPFGYGLSYTHFCCEILDAEDLSFHIRVTNTGTLPGKNTVQLYAEKPQALVDNPARELVAFRKTRLLAPGESQELTLAVSLDSLASYCDNSHPKYPACSVVAGGCYRFWLGDNARDTLLIGKWEKDTDQVLQQLSEAAAPPQSFPVLANREGKPGQKMAPARVTNLKKRIQRKIPKDIFMTGNRGYLLKDVKEGRVSLEAFTAQLTIEELEAISRGGYVMNHPLGARGNAGIFGGVTEALREKGIPPVVTTDGPSGIRLYDSCSLLPIGTLLACSFDTDLVEEVYTHISREMKEKGSDVLLAPGMNIHRNPLCGRNFEYFSEDPLLTGKIAAAAVRGIQSTGLSACPKHFACNNQEYNLNHNNSILSERALREIYLKGFEICVKESQPKNLMTSYNKINGVWGHYHYDLVQTILRGEWGYRGNILTDWWMRYAPSPEFPRLKGNAYRVRSGVNVLMPGSRNFADKKQKPDGTLLASFRKRDGITQGELQRNAMTVLQCVMDVKEL